ncbi:MAG: EpsI family protein [Gemmatimonadota bacterium]|nr:EpsI family protein [Gemmatimonadota bacterium]
MHKGLSYLPAGILIIGAAFVVHTREQSAIPLVAPLATVLDSVSGYHSIDQKISDDERRVAGMSNYVARAYTADSTLAFTTLVSYYERQTQGKTIHSPRNCLPGAGWEILNGGTKPVMADGAEHVVNHYVLKNGASTAIAYYWYQGRGRVVANEYRVKWNLLRDAALAGHTEEALVRVVVYLPRRSAGSEEAAFSRADSLGNSIAGRLIHDVYRVLPGGDPASGQTRVGAINPAPVARVALGAR